MSLNIHFVRENIPEIFITTLNFISIIYFLVVFGSHNWFEVSYKDGKVVKTIGLSVACDENTCETFDEIPSYF